MTLSGVVTEGVRYFIVAIFGIAFLLGAWFISKFLYKFFKKTFVKKEPTEDEVKWCDKAIDKGLTEGEVKKMLLIGGYRKDDLLFMIKLYREIKKLKGGTNGQETVKKTPGGTLPRIN